DRTDSRRPKFRDHRTPQFGGGGGRRHENPAHYPQKHRVLSPIRRTAGSPDRRQRDQRHNSPEVRRDHRERHRSQEKETKDAVVTSSSTAAVSSGSSRGATSASVTSSSMSQRKESGERRREADREEKIKDKKNEERRKETTDRSRSSNVAARIQAPVVSSSSTSQNSHRHHHGQQRETDWKKPLEKRPVDNRPMTYATDKSSSSGPTSSSRPRHSSADRHKSSSSSSRRREEDKSKDRGHSKREEEKKTDDRSSSSRRRDEENKDRNTESKREKKEEIPKEEKLVADETKEEDEAVAMQGLEEVDSCKFEFGKKSKCTLVVSGEGDESAELVPKPTVAADEPAPPSPEKSVHSAVGSNASAESDSEEELDYEEDDIDVDIGDDIDVETMKLAARGDLKVDDTTDEEPYDENEAHDLIDDDDEVEARKDGEPETKKLKTEKKEDRKEHVQKLSPFNITFLGSSSSKSHRRRDENKSAQSSSDRKERRRSRSKERPRDVNRKDARRNERPSTTERSTHRGGAGTEKQRIPSLLTMRIAAPPGIKKMETFYHSSGDTSSHSSEGVGETFSNRWCQCSCAHHMPSTSTAGSLDASPASTSSSNSEVSASGIPSLMSLRTPFNYNCLFLAPPLPPQPPRRSHEPAARIRAPSPPRRSFGDRSAQRTEDHRGGGRHVAGEQQPRRRSPERVRRDDRRFGGFEDRKRIERAPIDVGKNRSPLHRRRLSPPRGRPGEKVVQSYRNGV
ncbi:CRE-SEU-1 protein, partial [Caenorhabditis remanei]